MNTLLIAVVVISIIALTGVAVRVVRHVAGALRMTDAEIIEEARKLGVPLHDRQWPGGTPKP
jgi:hypothetical protein